VRLIRIKRLQVLVFCLVVAGVSAVASPIAGSISGAGFATVSFTELNFCPTGMTPSGPNLGSACTPAIGNQTLGGGSLSLISFTGDTVQSLNAGSEPIGVVVSLPNWLVFTPANGTTLTLTEILPGTFSSTACLDAPAAGQICSPAGSAFNLSNTDATDSAASFVIIGTATDGNPADDSPFRAIFSAQFGVPYQSLLTALSSGGGTGNYSSSYSVTITTTPTPEPNTLALLGAGLVVMGFLGRRKLAK
jgi:hypothetical protein